MDYFVNFHTRDLAVFYFSSCRTSLTSVWLFHSMAGVAGVVGGAVGGAAFLVIVVVLVYCWCRPRQRTRGSTDEEGASDLSPVPIVISGHHETANQRSAVKRKKIEYVIDAVLGRTFPKDKEPATVANSGIFYVDHNFVNAAPASYDSKP